MEIEPAIARRYCRPMLGLHISFLLLGANSVAAEEKWPDLGPQPWQGLAAPEGAAHESKDVSL